MSYETPQALRMALERRLQAHSEKEGVGLDRLRRRVVFERIVARLQAAEPGQWVLKGGMALEVRLRDEARLTKDIDLGLRDLVTDPKDLRARLIEALSADPAGDWFSLSTGPVKRLFEGGDGEATWRVKVAAQLAGRPFGGIQLDVSPRPHELVSTDLMPLPNSLGFAGILVPAIEVIDVHRHAAEKFHAMTRDYGDRDNTRVRDLVDLVILDEHDLLDVEGLREAIELVWLERNQVVPPASLPSCPLSWEGRYERLAVDHHLEITSFPSAVATVARLWAETFHNKET